LTRVAEYLGQIRDGAIVPDAQPEVVGDRGATFVVDGNWGFGPCIAKRATEWLIERTLEHGSGAVGIRKCGHVGRAGSYAELAANRELVALCFVNGGGTKPRVAPYGGGRPVFGTNPVAAAVPIPGEDPIVLDFSTAVVASGKIRVLRDRGEPLPDGWILDREGRPSNDPADYYDGGVLLPAADHKGYALCLLVELLAGCLTGAGSLAVPASDYQVGNGVFIQAIDVSTFMSLEEFGVLARSLVDTVRSTPPAAGFDEVLLPGDPERRSAAARTAEGVDVAESTWGAITEAASDLGVSVQ
jgi:LDH2 family malate/lactate/ureidoglycolate dehydrogenase